MIGHYFREEIIYNIECGSLYHQEGKHYVTPGSCKDDAHIQKGKYKPENSASFYSSSEEEKGRKYGKYQSQHGYFDGSLYLFSGESHKCINGYKNESSSNGYDLFYILACCYISYEGDKDSYLTDCGQQDENSYVEASLMVFYYFNDLFDPF